MTDPITFQHPTKKDVKDIYQLIKNSKPLDLNSEYLYLLQATYFSDTCMVAKQQNKVVGFVSGFIDPKNENVFFVWQVAVDSSARRQGLAFKMLKKLFSSRSAQNTKCIHTTISPSNTASQKLFEKLAHELCFNKEIAVFANKDDFANMHEEELLYQFKPIKGGCNESI